MPAEGCDSWRTNVGRFEATFSGLDYLQQLPAI
jgi:hypothetical protein